MFLILQNYAGGFQCFLEVSGENDVTSLRAWLQTIF